MKYLLAVLCAVLLAACGGSEPQVAATSAPLPFRLASPVSGDPEVALHLYQALYGKAPGYAQLNTFKSQIAANGAVAWANSTASDLNSLSNSAFAALVLNNISITPTSLTGTAQYGTPQQAYDGLLAGFVEYLNYVGVGNRGVVAAQLAEIISNLEVDTQFGVYGIAAVSFNHQMQVNLAYSSDATHSGPSNVAYPNFVARGADFGVKGDGLSDDAPAIQRAIDSLPDPGGVVVLGLGTFMLGSSAGSNGQLFPNGTPIESALIIRKNNVMLLGSGTSSVLKLMPNKKLRMLTVDRAEKVTIRDIVFDGNKASRDGSKTWPWVDVVDGLLYGNETRALTMLRVEARNGLEDGLGAWMSNATTIDNCYSHDNGTSIAGATGASLSGETGGTIVNSRFEKNTSTGIWLAFGSASTTVRMNRIVSNDGAGITIGGGVEELGAGNNHGFAIVDNLISGNGDFGFPAIHVLGAIDGNIEGNQIVDNLNGGILFDDEGNFVGIPASTNWVVTNNSISNTNSWRWQKNGVTLLGASKAQLKSNVIHNNGESLDQQVIKSQSATLNSDWGTVNAIDFELPTIADDRIAPRIGLDLPKPDSVFSNNEMVVAGWAFDTVAFDRVDILVDAVFVGPAILKFSRPDVQLSIPNAPSDSGFQLLVQSSKFKNGKHVVTARAIDVAGNAREMSVTIVVAN